MCKSTGLRILNGRHCGGFANDFTYCGPKSYSVIDYLITSPDLFPIIDTFIISSFNQYPDHTSLHVEIGVPKLPVNETTLNARNGERRKLNRWNDTNKIQCRVDISTNMDQLISLGDNLNFDTQDNLDKCVNDFSEYLSEIVSPFISLCNYGR